ncbi:hypothetical protein C0J52_16239, partial [Blattella germanica]
LRSPQRSTRCRAITVGISRTSLRRILHNDLRYHPYKIQIVQALHLGDNQQRIRFCDALLVRLTEDEDLVNNLWMNEEAHFHLSGFVNRQNFRYWSEANPRVLHEKPLHAQKVTV